MLLAGSLCDAKEDAEAVHSRCVYARGYTTPPLHTVASSTGCKKEGPLHTGWYLDLPSLYETC